MSEIDEKTILVTGCTTGIGLEVSKYLHEKGYKILLIGRNEEKLKAVSQQLGDQLFYVCDLEHSEQIKGIFSFCKANGIMLSGLIHSASGDGMGMPVRKYKDGDAKRHMQVNYHAFLELCKHFYSRKISIEGASIVAMSSLASVSRIKGAVMYSSAKNALNSAVSVISKEFIKRSIRVNAIMPAYVDTPVNQGLSDLIDVKERQPLGLITPRDVAYLIEFLLTEKSKYITGAFIPISAGMEV